MTPNRLSERRVHRFLEALGAQCRLGLTQECIVNL